jgi:hypothetical protein
VREVKRLAQCQELAELIVENEPSAEHGLERPLVSDHGPSARFSLMTRYPTMVSQIPWRT